MRAWIILLVCLTGCSDPARDAAYEASRQPHRAYLACREFVRVRLKSPSTAQFSTGEIGKTGDSDAVAYDINGTWHASGVVDSQNGFGAMIRTKWSGSVLLSEKGWELQHLIIGDELVADHREKKRQPSNYEIDKRAAEERERDERNNYGQHLTAEAAAYHEKNRLESLREAEEKASAIKARSESNRLEKLTRVITYQLAQASNGLPSFQIEVAKRYLKGDGLPQDTALATHWLKSACTNHDSTASNLLNGLK